MSRKRENYLSILLVMVWFTLNNAARSIELFNEDQGVPSGERKSF